MSLVRSATCGLLAGAAGTLAMDLVLFIRYKRGGGSDTFTTWEFPTQLKSWDEASAPAKVGKLVYESLTKQELPVTRAALTTNVMHWGYGLQWGFVLAYSIKNKRAVRPWQAPLFGALVWLASYVSLPIAGFYKPMWSYDLKTLGQDLSAHLVYGASALAAYRVTCWS